MASHNPGNKKPSIRLSLTNELLISVGFGIFVVGLIYVILRFNSHTIIVFVNGIDFNSNGLVPEWKFSKFEQFAIFNCGTFHVLILQFKNGRLLMVGIPEEYEVKALAAFLLGKGLYQIPPGFPLGPSHPIGREWLKIRKKLSPEESVELLQEPTHDVPPASVEDLTS